jgi:hypothetical protein
MVSRAGRRFTEEGRVVTKKNYTIHARTRVLEFVAERDLDRLAQQACAAAEGSQGWRRGEEFIFEIEDEAYVIPEVELSAFIVRNQGESYEVFYYDGQMAETITEHCSWDR